MTIFGVRIVFEKTYQADLDRTVTECNQLLTASNEQLEFWKAKYYYAKARAVVAEQFQQKTTITVKPVAMGVDSGVQIEVGHKSETEIREQ